MVKAPERNPFRGLKAMRCAQCCGCMLSDVLCYVATREPMEDNKLYYHNEYFFLCHGKERVAVEN